MWRTLPALAVLSTVLGAVTGSSASSIGITCGAPTKIDRAAPLGRAASLDDTLWLAVYPFSSGYPTKMIVMAQHRLPARIALRGWSCADGGPLRFWYRDRLPFGNVPVSSAALRRKGGLTAGFGPWPTHAMRGGYVMFWRSGLWKIVAYRGGRSIGTAIVRAAPG
jgi:hypothetical protein